MQFLVKLSFKKPIFFIKSGLVLGGTKEIANAQILKLQPSRAVDLPCVSSIMPKTDIKRNDQKKML